MSRRYLGSWVLCSVVLVGACSDGSSERSEARALLSRLSHLEADAPFAERNRQLELLDALPLRSREIASIRDTCVAAHRALLESEVAQAEAKRGLRALEGASSDEEIPQRAALEGRLNESRVKLRAARDAYPDCRDRTLALAKRYRN